MKEILLTILVAVLAYLIGSVSTGIILSSRHGTDIRTMGSHNPGATNMMRVMGKKMGVITFIGDALKALLACLIGYAILPGSTFGINQFGAMIAGIAAILGHNWPVYYGFKGGKGVACSVAVIIALRPLFGVICLLIFFLVTWITKYVSVGSLSITLCFTILSFLFSKDNTWLLVCALIMMALCILRHLPNIKRLLNGTENKASLFSKKRNEPNGCMPQK